MEAITKFFGAPMNMFKHIYEYYHCHGRWDIEKNDADMNYYGPNEGYGPHAWHNTFVDHELECVGTEIGPNGTEYKRYSGADAICTDPDCKVTDHWYFRGKFIHTTDEIVEYWMCQEPIYNYFFKKETELESTTDPSDKENVSNVKKYVKYRSK